MDLLISFGIMIVSGIYKVAAWTFELFIILATGELVTTESYKFMIDNVYLILGIILLFILAFSLLKSMVNPEDQKQGTSMVKKVIINLITSGIIMAVLPTIFTFAYDFQDSFINKYNVLGKFFGYGSLDSTSDSPASETNLENVRTGAYTIVNGVYTAFFNVNSDWCGDRSLEDCQQDIESDKKMDYGADYGDGIDDGKHSLYATMNYVEKTGKFNTYNNFSKSAADDKIEFNFILSLIGSILLVYVAFSFCFDMAVRMIKLVFYQLIAPIPIFFRVIPDGKLSGTFKEWVKVTFACYFEVYTRIFVFYFCIFLCNQIVQQGFFESVSGYNIFLGLLAKAFVFMGLVTFMRQAPGLLSKVTGLDSGNIKLGIRDKLAAGGAFTAGAVAGGALTAGVRNATNAWQNNFKKGEDGKWHKKEGISTRQAAWNMLSSTAAGTVSGGVRSGKTGLSAKSSKDMKNAAASGASSAVNARDKRAAYKASHDNRITPFVVEDKKLKYAGGGTILGHIKDVKQSAEEYIGISMSATEVEGYYTKAANTSKSYNDAVEKTYKTKDSYIDLDNKVKAMKQLQGNSANKSVYETYKNNQSAMSIEERDMFNKYTEYLEYKSALENMRIEESMKKVSNIRSAAYRLSYDHKMNYSNDKEMIAEFESGLSDGFFDKKGSTATLIGLNAAGEYEFKVKYTDSNGNSKEDTMTLDSKTYRIYEAMKNGEEFDTNLINQSNVIRVQDAIDNVNIHRQNLNTRKADEAFRAQQEKKKQEGK